MSDRTPGAPPAWLPTVAFAVGWAVVVAIALAGPWFWQDRRLACNAADPPPIAGGQQKLPLPEEPGDARSKALFLRALEDARQPTADEIHALWPIAASNQSLKWTADGSRVLVATLMRQGKFEAVFPFHPAPFGSTKDGELWVTPVPQVREFCRATELAGEDLARRVKQHLGLRTEANYAHMVELWVRPEDLFRPCSDPEIEDTRCSLEGDHRGSRAGTLRTYLDGWYCPLRAKSYSEDRGLPWTRLGYTYDWADGADEVGASEYVIGPGVRVRLHQAFTLDAYCRLEG